MKTEYVRVSDPVRAQEDIDRAAAILRAGGLVVFPTETVYGLGGNATDDRAAQKIYEAKGRPSDNPLIIHICEPADAERYAHTCDLYYRLARQFMPGPLTVILPKKDTVPSSVTGGLETVAVRCPAHPVARALIRAAGVAVAAPSANRSGKPSPTCAPDAYQDLDGRVDLILDGGACEIGLESTIVLLQGDEDAVLLRPGAVTYDALCCVCRKVTVPDSVLHTLSESERPLSPGMKYRHYAPDAPLVLLDGPADAVLAYLQNAQKTERCTILCYEEELPFLAPVRLLCVGGREDLSAQAQSVFRLLREADRTDGRIVYAHLPPRQGLGLALYNRMIRAAAHQIRTVSPKTPDSAPACVPNNNEEEVR